MNSIESLAPSFGITSSLTAATIVATARNWGCQPAESIEENSLAGLTCLDRPKTLVQIRDKCSLPAEIGAAPVARETARWKTVEFWKSVIGLRHVVCSNAICIPEKA